MIPARNEEAAIAISRIATGRIKVRTVTGGRLPIRAEIESKTPSAAPTHHVANIPHSNAKAVGEVRGRIIG